VASFRRQRARFHEGREPRQERLNRGFDHQRHILGHRQGLDVPQDPEIDGAAMQVPQILRQCCL